MKKKIKKIEYYFIGFRNNKEFIENLDLFSYEEKITYKLNFNELLRINQQIKQNIKTIFWIHFYKDKKTLQDNTLKLEKINSKFNQKHRTYDPIYITYKEIEEFLDEILKNLIIGNNNSLIYSTILLAENFLEAIIIETGLNKENDGILKPKKKKSDLLKFQEMINNKSLTLSNKIEVIKNNSNYYMSFSILVSYLEIFNCIRSEFIFHPYHLDRYSKIIDKKQLLIKKLNYIKIKYKDLFDKIQIYKEEAYFEGHNITIFDGKKEFVRKSRNYRTSFAINLDLIYNNILKLEDDILNSKINYQGLYYDKLNEIFQNTSISFLLYLSYIRERRDLINFEGGNLNLRF